MKFASLALSLVALVAFSGVAEARGRCGGRFFHRHHGCRVVHCQPCQTAQVQTWHAPMPAPAPVVNYGRDNLPPTQNTIILAPNQGNGCDGGRCWTFPILRRGR